MNQKSNDPYFPHTMTVLKRREETKSIFTLDLCFQSNSQHKNFLFHPGQFNMLYLFGAGEVAISISSDPRELTFLSHTIRAVGRVTKAMQRHVREGDTLGLRGPFGNGWPLKKSQGKDIIIMTGGLGCAPTLSVINYILARRQNYGKLTILQGVKHSDDFIFRKQYALWQQSANTKVYIAADRAGPTWPFKTGYVTDMIDDISIRPEQTTAMMCGPEGMMHAAVSALKNKGMAEEDIYLSMERNMECGLGHCGHCQYGGLFVCKDGPVFSYPQIKDLFSVAGF